MLEATGIHQVLAWDITLIPGPAKGQFFYLYMGPPEKGQIHCGAVDVSSFTR